MAKRRKKIMKRRHHRRKVSGIGDKLELMDMALAVGGAVAAKILNNKLAASTNATMQKAAPYSGLILGIVLPLVVKNNTIEKLSIGLVAGGGVTALGSTGLKVISGFENTVAGIGYPYYQQRIPFAKVAGVGATAGTQGLTKGTHSNFSGSRNSQMNTIAGIGCCDNVDGSAN